VKEEGTEIHWEDETGSVSMPANLKGYCPKGQTPVLKHSAKKQHQHNFHRYESRQSALYDLR